MSEDLIIALLEYYKQHKKVNRKYAFQYLHEIDMDLEYVDFGKVMERLLNKMILAESGDRDTYVYFDKEDKYLNTLWARKRIRDKKEAQRDRTEAIKNWRERNWLLIAVGSFFAGTLAPVSTTLILQQVAPEKEQSKPTPDTTILRLLDTVYIDRYPQTFIDTTRNSKKDKK